MIAVAFVMRMPAQIGCIERGKAIAGAFIAVAVFLIGLFCFKYKQARCAIMMMMRNNFYCQHHNADK